MEHKQTEKGQNNPLKLKSIETHLQLRGRVL